MRATSIAPTISDIDPSGPGISAAFFTVIPNIWLRSESDPNFILGRPVVCGLIDDWSRCLLALTFSFNAPNWFSLSMALESALLNKVDLCNQYGVSITQAEWPAEHLPQQIAIDRGELGNVPDAILTRLGITIKRSPLGGLALKGILERNFAVINHDVVNWQAAFQVTSAQSNKGLNKGAPNLTPREFQRLLINTALRYNNSVLSHYRLTREMIVAGIKPRPSDLLLWGMANIAGLPKSLSLAEARLHFLPRATALITPYGIRYRGICFTCALAVSEGWFEQARQQGARKIEIAYDPLQVDRIYLIPPGHEAVTECELTPQDCRFSECTWAEVEAWRNHQRDSAIAAERTKKQNSGAK